MPRVAQTVLTGPQYPSFLNIQLLDYDDEDDDTDWELVFKDFLASASSDDQSPETVLPVGFSLVLEFVDPECKVRALAFSTTNSVLLVKTPEVGFAKAAFDERRDAVRTFLAGTLISGDVQYTLVALELGSLALALHRDSRLPIKALDLSAPLDQSPGALPVLLVIKALNRHEDVRALDHIWSRSSQPLDPDDPEDPNAPLSKAALRAWVTVTVAHTAKIDGPKITAVDTHPTESLTEQHLDILAELQLQYELLEAEKPRKSFTDFSAVEFRGQGEVAVLQTAFKNKLRMGKTQQVTFLAGGTVAFEGQVSKTKGKEASVFASGATETADEQAEEVQIDAIQVTGREDLTGAEVARVRLTLSVLQGAVSMGNLPFVRKLWFPDEQDLDDMRPPAAKEVDPEEDPSVNTIGGIDLNPSQAQVARAMMSECTFALVHGPPGTGKTRTIAAVVKAWVEESKSVYLAAQSNVAVKNIAETLAKQKFTNFKLVVSSEFFNEWHEHIYEACRDQMIRSEELRDKKKSAKDLFGDATVILCTLDMLFNFQLGKLFHMLPMERLVVDEASQIFVGAYAALFHKFQKTLQKVCWFGDPKQLPPHQREQISRLDSVYDIPHIKESSMLLDTQYRMPRPIGSFISRSMYDGKLRSHHEVTAPSCLRFVDVAIGEEVQKSTSWVNEEEVKVMVHLVQHYYAELDYCIITPYDSQRKAIERALLDAGLPVKCFNVDSFQGNEADYIIISTVRTSATGFLDLHNRVNVMLTRCKQGMVIVTQHGFIRNLARMTLVGRLADEWGAKTRSKKDTVNGLEYVGDAWVYYKDVIEHTADLPGAPGIKPQEEVMVDPPKPVLMKSPSGFHAAPRNPKTSLPMFNGLTPAWVVPTSSKSNDSGPSTRRYGPYTLVGNEPPPRPAVRPAGPLPPTSGWNIPRPAIQAPSKPTSGAWSAGRPSPKPPPPKEGSWPSATSSLPSKGKTNIRVGPPAPRVDGKPQGSLGRGASTAGMSTNSRWA